MTSEPMIGQNPVTATSYNNTDPTASNEPLGAITSVTYGSGDSDAFTFDKKTGRETKYTFTVAGQTDFGTLSWNANGSLGSFNVTDNLNSTDTQNCVYSHDDLGRIASVNCGTAQPPANNVYGQTFSYDQYGNITKTQQGGAAGNFNVSYSNNQITSTGFAYDPNGTGNMTTDGTINCQYTWDSDGRPHTLQGVTMIYDAFDRVVEASGNYIKFYGPTGDVTGLVRATDKALIAGIVPLMGGGWGMPISNGIIPASPSSGYRHPDWLGSYRLRTTVANCSPAVYSDLAYAPFGESYANYSNSNCPGAQNDPRFTGQSQYTVSGLFDFPFREYEPNQGRWISPDPAGLAAVNMTDPQSWNRYAYVGNSPLDQVDPEGFAGNRCGDTPLCHGKQDVTYFPHGYQYDPFSMLGQWVTEQNPWVVCTGSGMGGDCMEGTTPVDVWVSSAGSIPPGFDPTAYFSSYYAGLRQQQINSATKPPTSQDYINAISAAMPTMCGGGAFAYAGLAKEGEGGEGFVGGLAEYDSHKGASANVLVEAGGDTASGGVAVNSRQAEPLFFFPVAAAGGLVLFNSGVGVYAGTPYTGGGGYLNITTNAACQQLQGH